MQVKVWNDNDYVLKERFKGEDIVIKPHEFVEMEMYEANDFRGQYHPVELGADKLQTPQSYKKIRIEKPSNKITDAPENPHVCMSCKKKYESAPVLLAHIETEHANATRLELPEVEEQIKRRGRPPTKAAS